MIYIVIGAPRGLMQRLQHAGVNLAVAGVLGGQLVIVECCCFQVVSLDAFVSDVRRLCRNYGE